MAGVTSRGDDELMEERELVPRDVQFGAAAPPSENGRTASYTSGFEGAAPLRERAH